MARLRITFDIDTERLFDTLSKMSSDHTAIGGRVVGVMLTGEAGFKEKLGMAMYGVEHVKTENAPPIVVRELPEVQG